jgi:hypothetical protein
MFGGGPKPRSRDQKLLRRQPPSSIDHNVTDIACGMIEDNVVNLAELLVILAVERCSSYVFGRIF